MTGELDAAGDAVTGAMAARAVEPAHGEAGGGHDGHGSACLNCGAVLTGPYCAACGQAAHIHRSFAAVGHDLAHGVLHFEGKIWRTLPELALRPGRLTRRYIRGERAKFLSPFALFLFSAFLMYAVFSLTSHHGPESPVKVDANVTTDIGEEIAKADGALAEARAKLAAPGLSADERKAWTDRLNQATEERQGLGIASNIAGAVTGTAGPGGIVGAVSGAARAAAENPELAYYRLKANAYKFSWALILISIPFVWLLFPFRRDYRMYDHAIYATYSIAFMSLLFSLSMLLTAAHVGGGLVMTALLLFAAWHMYRQMKDAYQLSRTGALLRLPFLYLFAAIALALFFTMLVMMG